MKYEIAFLSRNGSAAQMARSIAGILPDRETRITDINLQKTPGEADVCLIVFELQREACPFAILDVIEKLEGRQILLFAASGFGAEDEYRVRIERQIVPFLPENCYYTGLCLFKGRLTSEDLRYIQEQAGERGGRINQEKVRAYYEDSQAYPDEEDVRRVIEFAQSRLNTQPDIEEICL